MTMPLCGEHRFAYCYVKPSKDKEFKKYVRTRLKHCCRVFKSQELIKSNYFGLHKPSKNFEERTGDYTIIMKENYAIYDNSLCQKEMYLKGDHGGLSKEEMLVPLIAIKP